MAGSTTRTDQPPAVLPTPPDAPPDPAAVYREVARLVGWLNPAATEIGIVYRCPDGTGGTTENRLAVPVAADLPDDLEAAVLCELGKLRTGEWMTGQALAASVDVAADNGHYRRTLSRMARPGGPVESNRRHGYRLRQ